MIHIALALGVLLLEQVAAMLQEREFLGYGF